MRARFSKGKLKIALHSKGTKAMSSTGLNGHSTSGAFGAMSVRRARRAERQLIVNNLAVALAFLFVSAMVFGLVG